MRIKGVMAAIGGVVMGLAFTGCQQCVDCQYRYEDPETKDTLIYNYDKFCGTSDEVDGFEQRAKQEAKEVDGDLNCTSDTKWF